ncbi:MAG: peptidoglycan editing factor PgeF [Candidatus Riflebacteria bacterium]|nr:peptidoglycan editing factor PgeF [Candidatus Riflebacteria bacterium]
MIIKKVNGCTICFSQKSDGDLAFINMSKEEITSEWKKICKKNGLSIAEPFFLKQVHGSEIIFPGKKLSESSHFQGEADALITDQEDVTLGVFTADCLPVIIIGEKTIAAVHAGWKSTRLDITGKTINKILAMENILPSQITVFMGPCIGSCCLELGDEVAEMFDSTDKSYTSAFSKGKKWHLDLRGLNTMQALSKGIPFHKIQQENDCTKCQPDTYFSYRGDKGRSGSMFSFVARSKNLFQ